MKWLSSAKSIGAILLLAFVARTYHLAYPPWDHHNWRQAITLMVARDWARHGFDLLHPHVSWIGAAGPGHPSFFSAEFSLQSAIAAILYRAFGESDTLPRTVTIAFSLAGVYFLYRLIKRHASETAALLAALVYSLFPYHVFFGRVFMPDVPAISLALGGMDLLDRWSFERKWRFLLGAAVLTALAVLQKLTIVFVGLPMLYIFWAQDGKRFLVRREPYVFCAIVAIPAAAWYAHAAAMGRQSGFFIMQPFVFARSMQMWVESGFIRDMWKAVSTETFSFAGFALVIAGLLLAVPRRPATLCRLWLAGAALLLALIPEILPANHYYLSLLMPGAAGLAGMALARALTFRGGGLAVTAIVVLFAVDAVDSVLPLYQPDRLPRDLGVPLKHLTEPGDLLVTECGGSPVVLYFADRRGWMLEKTYDPALLGSYAQAGAHYYADAFLSDAEEHADFFRALDTRFERLTAEGMAGAWQVYDLARQPAASHDASAAEIQTSHSISANFGDQIELDGICLRRLLDEPAAFEVVYYWKCLKPIAANLRVFVHITNTAGATMFQWDHWPSGGRVPTSTWRVGQLIRERYIVGLPIDLPAGKYQVRVGWFDLERGSRLSVVRSKILNEDDRAQVGEIEVGTRKEGWFRGD